MIEELSAMQIAAIPEYIQKWIALADAPMNREKACEAIDEIYREMGEQKPILLFAQSPLQAWLMAEALKHLSKTKKIQDFLWLQIDCEDRDQFESGLSNHLREQIGERLDRQLLNKPGTPVASASLAEIKKQLDRRLCNQLSDQLRGRLWIQIWQKLVGRPWRQIESQFWNELDDQLERRLGNLLADEPRNQLRHQMDEKLRGQMSRDIWHELVSLLWDPLRYHLREQLWGQLRERLGYITGFDWRMPFLAMTWAGLYDFCKSIGVEFDESKYDLFLKFAEYVQFIIAYRGIAIVSEKPVKINWLSGNLHSHHEMSVQYGDGWGIYSWRGIGVPEKYIKDKAQITREDIINEKNAERRRCLREILGSRRFGELLELEEVDRDKVASEEAILWRTKQKDDLAHDHIQFVEVRCPSTGREYMLCVPPHIRDCWSAVAWTFGKIEREDYAPLIET